MRAAPSLRPHIVQVMAAHQGLILTTEEIYQLVDGVWAWPDLTRRRSGTATW